MYSPLGSVSWAMNTSSQPSSLKSATEAPIPLPGAAANPDCLVTSANLPLPKLRNNWCGTLGYSFGLQ